MTTNELNSFAGAMEPASPRAATDFVRRSTLCTARGRAGSNVSPGEARSRARRGACAPRKAAVRFPFFI
jgi:hypothetical protein